MKDNSTPQSPTLARFNPRTKRILLLLLGSAVVLGLGQPIRQQLRQFQSSQAQAVPSISPGVDPNTDPNTDRQTSDNILAVETIVVSPIDRYPVQRTYLGTITPQRQSTLGFQQDGQVTTITVDVGDAVTTGRVLAQLDSQLLRTEAQELEAEYDQALAELRELQRGPRPETIAAAQAVVDNSKAELELSQLKLERRQDLKTDGAISQEDVDEAITEVNGRQAQLDEAQSQLNELLAGTRVEQIQAQEAVLDALEAQLARARVEIDQTQMIAPFDGSIAQRLVDEGTVVSTGQAVLELVENQVLEAHVGVPIPETLNLTLGSPFTLQINQQQHSAILTAIQPQLDPQTLTKTLILRLAQGNLSQAIPGQPVQLQLEQTIETRGYWLPLSALAQAEQGLWSCYVLISPAPSESRPSEARTEGENWFTLEQRDLEILDTQVSGLEDSQQVLVRGNLQPGDRVVSSGIHRLVPGQQVRLAH
jgi:multidrug resistance efflux pump